MTRMTGSILAGAAAILTTAVAISPASAQLQAQVAWCGNMAHKFSLAMQIGGCTTLIDSGKMADKPLAWSHANRGMAYVFKGDIDKASDTLKKVNHYAQLIHMDLASNSKRLKNAEMLLHHTTYRLGEYLHKASSEDQATLKVTLKQLDQVHSELLAEVFKH